MLKLISWKLALPAARLNGIIRIGPSDLENCHSRISFLGRMKRIELKEKIITRVGCCLLGFHRSGMVSVCWRVGFSTANFSLLHPGCPRTQRSAWNLQVDLENQMPSTKLFPDPTPAYLFFSINKLKREKFCITVGFRLVKKSFRWSDKISASHVLIDIFKNLSAGWVWLCGSENVSANCEIWIEWK